MKTGERREDGGLAMAHSHGMRCDYIIIGDLTKEVGPQVAAVATQIFCLVSRRIVVVTRNDAGRAKHKINSAIVRVPRRGNGREQGEEDENPGNELHGDDESSASPSGCQTPGSCSVAHRLALARNPPRPASHNCSPPASVT